MRALFSCLVLDEGRYAEEGQCAEMEHTMKIAEKYNNYDLHPRKKIAGFDGHAWEGAAAVEEELKKMTAQKLAQKKKVVLCFDFYPGVDRGEIRRLADKLCPVKVIDTEDCAKAETVLNEEFYDYITEDRVFGVICHKNLRDFFEAAALSAAASAVEAVPEGLVVVMGVGTDFICHGDIYVYCDLTRWEIQLRYRKGMSNWHCTNCDAPVLSKYKRGFFIEWRLADRYKKARYEQFDYVLETETAENPKLVTGEAFRAGLAQLSCEPFRMEPYFDPGVWGGHWMQQNFGLDADKENFAWSFDGVPEENSLNLTYGDVTVKIPAIDLVLYRPHQLLGERVHARFGAEFPIRFDLLDTMGGGNLSLQVHPLTEYIQDAFGMHYTQDESYYLLDTGGEDGENVVYLGVKKDVDKEAMERDLKLAEKGEIEFPAENYVNKVPVKKHDHILIPAGTVHCSGKDTMVLEISATPYIFTFKLWDWGRVGLDGIPRPIHVGHGMKNIQWDRDTDWIYENLVHQEATVLEEEGVRIERTGLHEREFIDTHRYTLTNPCIIHTNDSVHVMNLVDGECACIESTDGAFETFEIHYAETAIVPADVGAYRVVPHKGEVKLIVASVRS